jgi:ribosomal protein S14
MEKKVRKDKNLRKKHLFEEVNKFIFSYSSKSILFNKSIRDNLCKEVLSTKTSNTSNRCVARCIHTGRRKRVNKWFNFSRLTLSRFIRTKKVIHWKKSKW